MSLWTLTVIAVALSADAFAVAVGKGLTMPGPTRRGAVLIAVMFGTFQGVRAAGLGQARPRAARRSGAARVAPVVVSVRLAADALGPCPCSGGTGRCQRRAIAPGPTGSTRCSSSHATVSSRPGGAVVGAGRWRTRSRSRRSTSSIATYASHRSITIPL